MSQSFKLINSGNHHNHLNPCLCWQASVVPTKK